MSMKDSFELALDRTELEKAAVSFYRSSKDSRVCVCTGDFGQVLNLASQLDDIQKLKEMKGFKHSSDPEKEERFKEAKLGTLAFTLTGTVAAGDLRTNTKDISNRFLIVDIDNIETSPENLKKVNTLPFVLGTGISCSGEGFWSVVAFELSEVKNKEDYTRLYKILVKIYEAFGIEIDKQVSDLTRLRVVSPYEFCWNDEYMEPFSLDNIYNYIEDLDGIEIELEETKLPKNFEVAEYKGYLEPTGNTTIWSEFQFRRDHRNGGVYRRSVKIPEFFEESNYHIRYSYANAIYRFLGEAGHKVYMNYFPEDDPKRLTELEGVWKSSRNWKGPVSEVVRRELVEQGILKNVINKEKENVKSKNKRSRCKSEKFSW